MKSGNSKTPLDVENQKFYQIAFDESERGLILIITSDLDAKLEKILRKYLMPSRTAEDNLFNYQGGLGSFSNRIEMVYRLGIIDASFANSIDSLRKSRNRMAHKISENLEESPHKDHLNNSMEQIKKSKILTQLIEVSDKHLESLKEHANFDSSLDNQFTEGRIKLRHIHMILSVLLDVIYKLLDGNIEKSKIRLGLASYDKDILELDILQNEKEE